MGRDKAQKKYTIPQDKVDYIIANYDTIKIPTIAKHLNITIGVARGNYSVYAEAQKEETIFDVTKQKWII